MSGIIIKGGLKTIVSALKENSSTILSALAVIGVGATVYFAVEETPKVQSKLEAKEEEKGEPLTIVEKAAVVIPGYKKTAASAVGTVACIVGAQKQNLDKIAMYSASSMMFKDKLTELSDKIEEKVGPKKTREIMDAPAEDYVMSYPPADNNIINTGRGVSLCMDDLTGTYFYSDKVAIDRAVSKMRCIIAEDGCASKNQWLNLLYLDEVSDGDYSGWNNGKTKDFKNPNTFDIEFTSVVTPDGRPCLVVQHTYSLPIPDYDK